MIPILSVQKRLGTTLRPLTQWHFWRRVPLRLAIQYLSPDRCRPFPEEVQIEATSRCNLQCPSCSHSRDETRGKHLSVHDLQRILDALPIHPARVILSGIGEPLMNPHFFRLVDGLADRGIQCVFFTNGTLLGQRTREAILLRPNIEEICISCDGSRKSTFETLRVGANFDKWKQQVRLFLAEARQRRGEALRIVANVVVSNQNLTEVPEIIALTHELGFDAANVMELVPADYVSMSLRPSDSEVSMLVADRVSAPGLPVNFGFRRTSLPPKSMVRCIQPWEYIFIRANGDVSPCCAIFGSGEAAIMGNIFEATFADIWHGERFRGFRRSSASGTNSLCRICPYY